MQIDEFSRNEWRESHASIQELTSQLQELQERMNQMSDSTEFQDVGSSCSGSPPTVVPSFGGMLSRDQSLRSDTWNLLGTSHSTCSNRFVIDTLSREVKNEIEKLFQRRDLQGNHQP